MNRNHHRSHTWISLMCTVIVIASILLAVSPANPVAAATQYMGGYARTGDLRILLYDDGSMGVDRYTTTGYWEGQIYGGHSKGSRLQYSGGSLALGYYTGSAVTSNYNNLSSTGTAGSRTWTGDAKWTGSGFEVYRTVIYREGDPYFKLQWQIVNVSGSTKSDIRFFHGEDTYLRGGDNGAGWVDWGNYTIGVKKNVGSEGEQRLSLQGITPPTYYQSNNWSTVRSAVNGGSLSNTIDPNESTDNGYALEWTKSSMANGESWAITAYEKFNNAAVGGNVEVIAPVAVDCLKGNTCNLNYTVKNSGGATITVALTGSVVTPVWGYASSWPGDLGSRTLSAGQSTTVTIAVAVPANAANGSAINVKLTATSGSQSSSDTGSVNAVTPPNSAPTAINFSGTGSYPENNGANQVLGSFSGSDPDGDALSYSLLGGDTGSFNLSGNSLRNNASFNYEAKNSYSITVRASDGKGGTLDRTFAISVTNLNEAPALAAPGAQSTNEDTPLTVNMAATDPDGNTGRLSWSLLSAPSHGVVSGATGTGGSKSLTYTPGLNYPDLAASGPDSFTIRVTGEGGTTSDQTVAVTVNAVNDPPANAWNGSGTFGGPLKVRVGQTITFDDGGAAHVPDRIQVADVDAANLQVTLTVSNGVLALSGRTGLSGDTNAGGPDSSLSFQGTITAVNAALKGLQYTPTAGYSGSDTLTLLTSDQGSTGSGGTKTDQDTVSLQISNPATLTVDDDFSGATADWGYDHFSRIEDAVAAAQSISAPLSLEVNAGAYPNDSILLNQPNLTLKLMGPVSLGKDFTLQQGAFNPNGQTLTFVTGAGNQTSHTLAGAPTFANLVVDDGNTLVLANNADLGLTGSLALNGSGALNASGGANRTTVSLKGAGAQSLPSGLTLDNLSIANGVTFHAPAALTLSGDLSNGGVYDGATGTVTFAGPAGRTQQISGNVPQFHNLVLAAGAALQPATDLSLDGAWTGSGSFDGNGKTVTFNGSPSAFSGTAIFSNVAIPAGKSLNLAPGADLGYTGAFDNQGSFDPTASGATVRLAGLGTQTLPAGAEQYHHLVIGPGATLNADGRSLVVNGDLTANGPFNNAGGSTTFAGASPTTHNLTGSGAVTFGSLNVAAGNTLEPAAGKPINVQGDWANAGTFDANGGTVVFNGTTQTFHGTTSFKDVRISSANPLVLAGGADFGFSGALTGSQTLDARSNQNTTVHIQGAGPQTLPANLDNLDNLVVDAGAILNLANRDLSLRGNLTNLGALDQSGGRLSFEAGASHALSNGPSSTTQLDGLAIAAGNSLDFACDAATPLLVRGDWAQAGAFTAHQCSVVFNGSGRQDVTGSGIRFYNLTVNNTASYPNDDTDVNTLSPVEVTHTLQVLKGQFQPKGGSTFKDVVLGGDASSEDGILRPNTTETLFVSGNWERKAYGWFDANSGTVEFNGSQDATIQGGATFYNMKADKVIGRSLDSTAPVIVEGTLTASYGSFQPSANSKFKHITILNGATLKPKGNINISGDLDNSHGGAYVANGRSVTFDGGSIPPQKLSGRVNFYNLTVNQGTTLEMQQNAFLGYQGALVLKGMLDATTHPHNTVEVMGGNLPQPQALSGPGGLTVNDLVVDPGSSLKLAGNLTVTGNMAVVGAFDANGSTVTFAKTGADQPAFAGAATFASINIADNTTFTLQDNANLAFTGSISHGDTNSSLDGASKANTTLTATGAGDHALPDGARIGNLVIADGATLKGGSANLHVAGNWTYASGGTFAAETGTVTFEGGAQTISGGPQAFNRIVVDQAGVVNAGQVTTTDELSLAAGAFKPACGSTFASVNIHGGVLELPSTGPCAIAVRGDWAHTAGTFTPHGGTVAFDNGNDTGGNHTLSGASASLAGLALGVDDSLTLANGANLSLAGPVNLGDGYLDGDPASTLTVTGNISLPTGTTLGNLAIASGASLSANDLTVVGDLTNDGGALNASGALALGGDLTNDGGTINNAGGSFTFGGGTSHAVTTTGMGAATNFGDLIIPAGETLDQNGEIRVAGNWLNQGTYTPNTTTNPATVVFNGTANQTIQTDDPSGNAFYNLTIDNSGAPGLVSSMDTQEPPAPLMLAVGNNLTILNGRLDLPAGSTLQNVSVAEGAVIGLPEGTNTITVAGSWANEGTMTLAGTDSAADVVDGPAYLTTSIVDQSFDANTPGLGFDKFTAIGDALPVTASNVIVYGGSSGFVTYAETIDLNSPGKVLTFHGDTSITSLTLTSGAIELADQAAVQTGAYAQSGGAFHLGNGSLVVPGDFSPTGGSMDLGTGTLSLASNFAPSGYTFNPETGKVEFNGSGPQTIAAGASFYDLKINNSAAAPDDTHAVVPAGAIGVTNNLDVVDGQFMPFDETSVKYVAIAADGILKLAPGADLNFPEDGSLDNNGMLILNGGRINGLHQGNLRVDDDYTSATSGFGYDAFDTIAAAFASSNGALPTGTVHVRNGSYAGATIDQSGWTVAFDDDVTFTGSLNVTNGTLSVANEKTLKLAQDFSLSPASAFVPNQGTVELTGSAAQVISGPAGLAFYNLTVNNSGLDPVTTTNAIQSNGDLLVQGGVFQPACGSSFKNVTVQAVAELRLADSACAITVSGTWAVLPGGTFTPNGGKVVFTGPNAAISGDASFASLEIAGGQLTAPLNGALTVSGDWTNHGTFIPNDGTVAFPGGAHALLGSPLNFHNLAIADGGILAPAGDLLLTGDWAQAAGGVFIPGNHKVTFNGMGPQAISGPAAGIGFYDFEVAQGPGATLVANPAITVAHHLEIATGELELHANSSVHNVTNDATGHLGAAGKLTLVGTTTLNVDLWSSDGGQIQAASINQLIPGKVSAMIVDAGFTAATPGFGIDHFATITDALAKDWLANGATVTVKPGVYVESVTVGKPVHLVAGGSITLNNLTLNDAGADFTAPGALQALTLNGNLAVTAGAFIDNGGTLVLDGTATHTLSTGLALNNLTIETGSTLTMPAALTLKGSLVNDGTLSGNGTLTVAGNLLNNGTLNGGTIGLTFDNPSAAYPHSLGGSQPIALNDLAVLDGEGLALSNNSTLSLKGSLVTTGSFTTGNGSTLALAANGVQTLPAGLSLWNLDVANGTTFTVPATLNLAGNLNNFGTINAAANTSTVRLADSGVQNISANDVTFYNLTIDDADDNAGANDVRAGAVVNVTHMLDIADGKFSPSACGQYADVTIGAAGEFAPRTGGSCAQKVSGNWTNDGSFTAASGKVAFNGAGSQVIAGSVDTSFNDLEIANTSSPVQPVAFGAGRKAIVNGALTVTSGEFRPSTGSQLHDVDIQGGKLTAPAGPLEVSGSWTNASADFFDSGSGVVRFTGGSHAIAGPTRFNGLEATGGNSLALDPTADVTVTGALNLTPGGAIGGDPASTLFFNGNGPASLPDGTQLGNLKIGPNVLFNSPANLSLSGGLTNLGAFNAGTGTVAFNGSGTPSLQGNVTFYNLAVDTATLTPALGSTLMVAHGLTAASGGNIDGSASGSTFIAAGPGIVLPGGAKLNHLVVDEGASISAPGALTLYGDLTANGDFDNSTGSTTFAGASPTTHNLAGPGAVTFGDLNIAAGNTLKPAAGMSINVKGNWDNDGVFDANGGTVVFTGAADQTIGGENNTTFANLTVNNSGALSMADGRSLAVQNDLQITDGDFQPSTGSSFHNVSIGSNGGLSPAAGASITVSGDWSDNPGGASRFTSNGGTVSFTGPGQQLFSGDSRFNNLQVTGGTLVLYEDADLGYGGTFTFGGGGALDATSHPGATLTLTGPGPQTLPDGLTLNDLTVAPGAALNGAGTGVTLLGDLTADGDVQNGLNASFNGSGAQNIAGSGAVHLGDVAIGPGSTLVPDSTLNGNTLYVLGDWTNHNTAGGFTPGSGTVAFEGAGPHILGGEQTTAVNNLNVLGGVLSGQIAATGATTIANGATLQPDSGSVFHDITLQDGGTLSPADGAAISVSGDWTDDNSSGSTGGFRPNSGTVTLNGTGDQAITVANPPASFANLVIAGSAPEGGSRTVTPSGALGVTGDLTLNSGSGTLLVPDQSTFTNVNISADSTFQLANDAHFTLDGSWSNQGTYSAPNGSGMTPTENTRIASVTVDPDTCAVDADACGVDRFGSIQAAVNTVAADGAITVLPGTHALADVGTINLNKSARLIFAGDGSSIFTLPDGIGQSAGTIIAPSGTLVLNGDLARSGGTFNANDGTVRLVGSSIQAISGSPTTFYNLTIDDADDNAGANDVQSGALVNVTHLLDIADGKFSPSACGQYADVTIGADGVFAPQTGSCAQKVSGNWTNDGSFTAGSGKVAFNGEGSQVIAGSVDTSFNDLEIANTSSPVQPVAFGPGRKAIVNGALTVTAGEFQPSAGSQLTNITVGAQGTLKPASGAEITVSGNWNNLGAFTHNHSKVTLTSSGTDQVLAGNIAFYNLVIDEPSPTTRVDANGAVSVANDLTLTQGIFEYATGASFKDVTVKPSGILRPDQSASFSISGNWTNQGAFDPNQGTVVFNGSGPQSIQGLPSDDQHPFYNLTVANTAAPEPACTTTAGCNTFFDANSVHFDGPIAVAGLTTVEDGQFSPADGSSFEDVTVATQGRFRAENPSLSTGTLTITGSLRNYGLFDLNSLTAEGNFALDQVYVSSEYDEATPGYGVDHFDTIAAGLNAPGLLDGATVKIYAGTYTEEVSLARNLRLVMVSTSAISAAVLPVTIDGSLTLDHPQATLFAPDGELQIGGDFTLTRGTFTRGTGAVTFNGAATQHISGGPRFYDLKIANTSDPTGDEADVDADTALTVDHLLDVADGQFSPLPCSSFASVTIRTNGVLKPQAAATGCNSGLQVSGNWTNSGGSFTPNGSQVTFNGSNPQTVTGESGFGDVTIGDGARVALGNGVALDNLTILPTGQASQPAGATLTVNGDWDDQNPDGGLNAADGTVAFAGTDSHTFTGNTTFPNVTVGAGSNLVLGDGANLGFTGNLAVTGSLDATSHPGTTVTVAHSSSSPATQTLTGTNLTLNDLVIDPGSTLSGAGQILTLVGDFTNDGVFNGGDGAVTFNGSGDPLHPQHIQGSGDTNFNDLNISNPVVGTNPADVTGALTVQSDGTFQPASGLTFHDVTIQSTGTLDAPAGNLNVTGDWNNLGTFDPGNSGTVTFNGAGPQELSGTNHFNNLVIDNPGNTVTLNDPVTVDGALNVDHGNLVQVQSGSSFDTIVVGPGGTFTAEDGAQDIDANHLNISGGFQTPNGTFKPSNILWASNETGSISMPEKPVGLTAGTLKAVDLNQEAQGTFTYTLVDDTQACGQSNDNSFFILSNGADGLTSVKTRVALDYETHPQPYALCVRVTDPTGLSRVKTLTVAPVDANDEPVVAVSTVSVDEDGGATALTITASDQDATFPHTLTWNTIDPAGITHGDLIAAPGQSGNTFSFSYHPNVLNWNGNTESFTVKVTDGAATTDVPVHINVLPVNDPPINEVLPNVSPATPIIGQKVQATSGVWNDNNDLAPGSISVTYQWQRSSDGSEENAQGITGAVESAYYPAAADQGQWLRVQVTAHDTGEGLPASQSTTVNSGWIKVPGAAPVDIQVSHLTVAESQPVGTTVGVLKAIDPDAGDTFAYQLVSGAGSEDNSQFSIAGNLLKTNAVFDYAAKNLYHIRIQATDGGGNTYEQAFQIAIVGLQAEVQPKSEATLDYAATELNPTETNIQVPYGSILDPMTLLFIPRQTVDTVPEGQSFASHAFDLTAIINGQENKSYELNKPFTFTLTYPDASVRGIDEKTMDLKVWSGSAWESAACGETTRDLQANRLTVPVCRLGEFALFGDRQQQIFLPLVTR
ncbi:MAG TPA: cadherin domain-containing protein [Anaerolineaceae bacterium]|nr:cadherin domain-containing protein [Anaerolineaceae bacterium]